MDIGLWSSYASILRQCAQDGDVEGARKTQRLLTALGYDRDPVIDDLLLDIYSKCGSGHEARAAFARIRRPNQFSWTAMLTAYIKQGDIDQARAVVYRTGKGNVACWNGLIAAYAKNGYLSEAFQAFGEMNLEGTKPDQTTFIAIVNAGLSSRLQCKQLHANAVSAGVDAELKVANGLIILYSTLGCLEEARAVFDRMPEKSPVSWNIMLAAFARRGHLHLQEAKELFLNMPDKNLVSWNTMISASSGCGRDAVQLFHTMCLLGVKPDRVTFINLFQARLLPMRYLSELHLRLIETGLHSDTVVATSLIDAYGRYGSLDKAWKSLEAVKVRDAVAWSAMLAAHSRTGTACARVLALMDLDGFRPPPAAVIAELSKRGLISDAWETWESRQPDSETSNWNAMIAALAQNGQAKQALQLFRAMLAEGRQPDQVTLVTALDACTALRSIGDAVSSGVIVVARSTGLDAVVKVRNALMTLYAKSGCLDEAEATFDATERPNLISWSTIIAAYVECGSSSRAAAMLQQMCLEGAELPDGVTFLTLLAACSHRGLLADAITYFVSMTADFFVLPTEDHYNCLMDLLGRAGELNDAELLLRFMPFYPGLIAWTSFHGAWSRQNE